MPRPRWGYWRVVMLIRNFASAFAALFLIFAAKSATANTLMCHSCTDLQMEGMAWEALGQMKMYGPHYIVNLDRGVVRKYIYRDNMTPEFDPEFDPFEAWVEIVPVEPQISTAIAGITQDMIALKREAADVLHIPANSTLPADGYESVISSTKEQALVNYITEHNKFQMIFANWFDQFDIPYFNEDYVWFPQPIEYASGDTAIYQYNKYAMKWERVPDSLTDAAGNKIPESAPEVGGNGYTEYEFPNTNDPQVNEAMTNLIDYAGLTGHNVVDARGGVTAGGFYVVTCTETTCTIWYIQ